jgi:menaquinone-dependent protoporphyrinogen oxidase
MWDNRKMATMSILIAYTTNSGSTSEVARTIGEELEKLGIQVEVRRLEEVSSVESYRAVIVGAPMILGWHRAAKGFVKKHREALIRIPVAYFCTAMSLTQTGDSLIEGIPIAVDPRLAKPPKKAGRLSLRERYATASNYLRPVLKTAPAIKPASVAFFGGKLELYRLKLPAMLFVLLIVQAQPADLRNWEFIRAWAAGLRDRLQADIAEGRETVSAQDPDHLLATT